MPVAEKLRDLWKSRAGNARPLLLDALTPADDELLWRSRFQNGSEARRPFYGLLSCDRRVCHLSTSNRPAFKGAELSSRAIRFGTKKVTITGNRRGVGCLPTIWSYDRITQNNHQKRQELRQHQRRFRPHDHRVRRADAVHLRHRQLALIRPAAPKDDVALPKPQLRADDIAALAPR